MADPLGAPSTRSAAVLLLALGEQEAATVFKHLDARVVHKLGVEMAQLKSTSREEVAAVLSSFVGLMASQADIKVGSDDYIRSVLVKALGDDKASGIIDRILPGRSSKGLEVLKWMEPRSIAETLKMEHPQVLAIILAYLDQDHAAKVLEHFPKWLQADVITRIATLDGVQPDALGKLDEMIEKHLAGNCVGRDASLGGPKVAAGILNVIDSTGEGEVIGQIRKHDEALCQKLQDLMFVFEDLVDVDDRGIQEILREVDSATLVLALKGADPQMLEKIMMNMPQHAAEMLKNDLESRGPVRLLEVETAQKQILAVARRLAGAKQAV